MPNRRYPLEYLCPRQRRRLRAQAIQGIPAIANVEVEDAEVHDDFNADGQLHDGQNNLPIHFGEDEAGGDFLDGDEAISSETEGESDDDEVNDLQAAIACWASEGVSVRKTNEILKILKGHHCFRYLPADTRTLLRSPRSVPVRIISGGSYCHIGIKKNISLLIDENPSIMEREILNLQCSIDGLPLAKSSGSQVWPIMMHLEDFPTIHPFVVGIFHGNEKPRSCSEYLEEFVAEMRELKAEGIDHGGVTREVAITAYVCDAPARAFVAQIKSHTGYFGCGKCTIQGEYLENRVIFDEMDAPLRTDASFSRRDDEDHHVGNSPLEEIPGTNMVTQFPFEYMHLVCLGVMRKLLLAWLKGSLNVRLEARKVNILNDRIESIMGQVPSEFARKPRLVRDLLRWKATEFRTFLAYTGPFLMINVLSPSAYKHFLSLHYAIRVLLSQHYRHHLQHAKTLLEYFVRKFANLYGRKNMSYNVHGLLHLVADSQKFGSLDRFSSFKFENKLSQIKHLVRKPSLPLPQIVKRLHERSFFKNEKEVTQKTRECRANPRDLDTFRLEAPCFSQYWHNSFLISTKSPNNCIISEAGDIIVVEVIASRNGEVFVVGRLFQSVMAFFDTPAPSQNVGIYSASNLSQHQLWAMNHIKSKAMMIAGENHIFYVVELLHH